jgi:hypothetical protein
MRGGDGVVAVRSDQETSGRRWGADGSAVARRPHVPFRCPLDRAGWGCTEETSHAVSLR